MSQVLSKVYALYPRTSLLVELVSDTFVIQRVTLPESGLSASVCVRECMHALPRQSEENRSGSGIYGTPPSQV